MKRRGKVAVIHGFGVLRATIYLLLSQLCVQHSQHPGSQTARPAADWWPCCQSPAPAWAETTCWRWFSCQPCEQSQPDWPPGWRCAEASASSLQSPGGERQRAGRGHHRERIFHIRRKGASDWLMVFPITHLREGLHQIGHHLVPVLGQDVVQRGSSLAVLPEHKKARILLIGRRRCTVVLEVLHWNAG